MKIKTDVEFLSFSDGVCSIYTEDEENNKTYKYNSLAFSNKILGYGRHFAAKAVQVKTDRVISIPLRFDIDSHDIIKINGAGIYNIELLQEKKDTNPPSLDLTLSISEILR